MGPHGAAEWLKSVQKPDGSFGETCASYDDPSLKGTGKHAIADGVGRDGPDGRRGADDPAVRAGDRWLIEHQAADGAWDEHLYTGTGFPRVFYLKYHLYRHYFPLMVLARYKKHFAR